MLRAADISTEMQARKTRNMMRLFNACLAFLSLLLVWARSVSVISASWLFVATPALCVGVVVLLRDAVVVLKASILLGHWMVARSDARARHSFTIRNKK